jgi:hypothetical protein
MAVLVGVGDAIKDQVKDVQAVMVHGDVMR